MNELEYFDNNAPKHVQGFTRILVTEGVHDYIGAWWPAGHIIGYEHTFVNQASDIATAFFRGGKMKVEPDFADSHNTQQVLDAVLASCSKKAWVKTGCK